MNPAVLRGLRDNLQRQKELLAISSAVREAGSEVVAIGIRSAAEAELCRNCGCRLGQGSWRAMSIDKFEEQLVGYSLVDRIGAGGYGEVWKAEAPGGLAKAVKFVYGYLAEERASRELKALQRIKEVRHPFLLSLERIEIIDGRLVIITELADGFAERAISRMPRCRLAGNSPQRTAALSARHGRGPRLHVASNSPCSTSTSNPKTS